MRITLINQFYPPARAPTGRLLQDLAVTLRDRGHEVTVLTSSGLYGSEAESEQPSAGIRVIRLGRQRRHGTTRMSKLMDYGRFYHQLRHQLSCLNPVPDAVISMTTPPFCGRWAQRVPALQQTKHIAWLMDLYPEALAAAAWMGHSHPVYRRLLKWAQQEREGATAVVVLGDDMKATVLASAPAASVHTIPVWSDLQATDADRATARALRSARGWRNDQCILLYSGNLGRAHDLTDIAAWATQVDPQQVKFVICGEGPMRQSWQQQWGARFEWLAPVDRGTLTAHLLSADVHVISQRPEWTGVVVPSKYQAACALGKPVLFSGPAESALGQWIRAGDTGWCVPPGDHQAGQMALAECQQAALRARKQETALNQAKNYFHAQTNRGKLAQLIEAVMTESAT